MPENLHNALLFLITTLFDFYLFILVVRMILIYVGSNYYDPLTQFVIKLTDFIIKPTRRMIPTIRRFETASFVLIILLELIKFLLVALLDNGLPNIIGLVILALADFLKLIIQSFFYAILLQALLSWLQPNSPMQQVLYRFTSPIMRPFQRLIPPINGMDISPIPALIMLQLLIILLVNPLMNMGSIMAMN